jgi:AcrR family transcriptional regulator
MNTRDRIIMGARMLFNERGYGSFTTASLAAELGIAEGNLWYHFKSKRALLEAIFAEFDPHIRERLAMRPGADSDIIGDYIAFLNRYIRELREYRFLYRDQANYGEYSEELDKALPDYWEETVRQLETYYASMLSVGVLDWSPDRLRDLALNVTIIIRFFLEYYRAIGLPSGTGSGAVHRSFAQHLTLFDQNLLPEAAARLREALSRIATQNDVERSTAGA